MSINNESDLIGMQTASKAARHILNLLIKKVKPGVSTRYLDEICQSELKAIGAESAPKKYYQAPCYAFYSNNNQIVHGLPNDIALKKGDLLKIDVTPFYNGYISDTAKSIIVGGNSANSMAAKLIECTKQSFNKALEKCKPLTYVHAIGKAIENRVAHDGFFIVKELTGHGVGKRIHEEPTIPNFDDQSLKAKLTEGLVIAVEPMACNQKTKLYENKDGWTLSTKKRSLTAHYEHTILITNDKPVVLTK